MPPRRGRAARQRVNESRADVSVEDEAVAQPSVPLRHQERQTEAESGMMAEDWLENMEELFDIVNYSDEKRLKMAL
ncbi:hypothetical protein F511_18939 [Dorcoceras hygrometricum]|uniref:Uncharacterized protein n=1 Tax=Dorcoceras hygrometricum TaxID=472368 RepID=A0A2Z7ABS8_9LAMI|nr:hypothetical protein F511_18939 [Dorcoceras hygrometricum]